MITRDLIAMRPRCVVCTVSACESLIALFIAFDSLVARLAIQLLAPALVGQVPRRCDLLAAAPSFDDAAGSSRPKLSNLDLIKADTPHTTAKISRMLHQLEFKLQVEMQYKKGIDKMAKLYQADGDKKSKADAESKRVESERKIQLLQTALKRYKTLHILDDADDEEGGGSYVIQGVFLYLTSIYSYCRTGGAWYRRREEGQPAFQASVWQASNHPQRRT